MRNFTWQYARHLLVTLSVVCSTGMLLAASPLVWEGENVKDLSGKAFSVMPYKKDPTGKVSGNKVLEIKKLPKGEKIAKDEVTYNVKIPANGTYYLWSRVLWSTGCGNSLLMSVGETKGEWILGGDGTYDVMHWISLNDGGRPRALTLKKGIAIFTLGSKESGVKVDQFLLTTDRKYVPASIYKPTANLVELK